MICEKKSFVSRAEAEEWVKVEKKSLKPYKCLFCPFSHLSSVAVK